MTTLEDHVRAPRRPPAQSTMRTMQCMEIWGGNAQVDNAVSMPGLDAWVYSKPVGSSAGGGDVHYLSSCATGRITRLLLADVSGHGDPVAAIGSDLRSLMRRYVNYLDQRRFIQRLNRAFGRISDAGGFATAFVATFWAPTSVLVCCNAGHPRPLWYRAKSKSWGFLEPQQKAGPHASRGQSLRNLPLGVVQPTEFEQFGVRFGEGDVIVLHTDSLIESRRSDGRFLGEAGLLEMASSIDVDDPHGFMEQLLARIDEWRADAEVDDDLTMLVLRRNRVEPERRPAQLLRRMGRFIREVWRGVTGRSDAIPWPEISIPTVGGAFFRRLNEWWGGAEEDPHDDRKASD